MKTHKAFTIVELLIVAVVIAILAAITIVAYNGITASAKDSALKSDLATTAKKVGLLRAEQGSYPTTKPSDLPDYIQYSQTNSGQGFCATASKEGKAFNITQEGAIQTGACSGHTVAGGESGSTEIAANSPIQNVTSAQCAALPTFTGSNTTAIRTVTDARGGTTRTYEIAKLADGKCWMLTNLKLGSTTGAITLTPADSNVASNFILPQVVATKTTDTSTNPGNDYDTAYVIGPVSDDTGAGSTNYGYLYNFSAATAGATRSLTTGNAPHSICPANWHLPSAGLYDTESDGSLITPGDFSGLDIAFGGTGNYADSGESNIARWNYSGPFRGVLSGKWWDSFDGQGSWAVLWSSSIDPSNVDYAYSAFFDPSSAGPGSGSDSRVDGMGVRCLLN